MLTEDQSVCCIGGITLDRTLLLDEPAIFGTSNPAKNHESCGGVARNVAENLARLSVCCQLIGTVGDDEAGTFVVRETSIQGVDTSLVETIEDSKTGSYSAVIQPDGELLIGVADMDNCKGVDQQFIDRCWSSITAASLVFADTNIRPESLEYLLERCRSDEMLLFVDAVSVAKSKRVPNELHGIDTFFCNLDEARAILGVRQGNDDAEATVMALAARGAGTIVVTAGADGLWCASKSDCEYLKAAPIEVVDVSGAGDALIAGTLFGRLLAQDPLMSCKMGLIAAGMTIGSIGRHCPDLSAATIMDQVALSPSI